MNSLFENINFASVADLLAYNQFEPLLFNTGLFLVLFVFFILIYQAIRNHATAKKLFTIAFSLFFYYKSSAECCFILLGVCLSDYLLGRWLYSLSSNAARRCIVALNVVVNLGMLLYFKYFNLLLETAANIIGSDFDALDIILPAGISFFTFRSISYIVDIYRGKLEPERNLLNYTFALTFFPPLLAGPVVRAVDILPQIRANRPATRAMVSEGMVLIMAGLIKKVIIADYISGNFVNRVFDNPMLYSGVENLLGWFGFSLQLYCDFSGYSDMAIGLALLLGYQFKQNFNAPFKAQNPSDFWRRWHISLSTWLRDYLYIPLGGNRHGKFRTYLNNILTMVLGGLWHGSGWMYLLWGAYHGLLLAIHKAFKGVWRVPEAWVGSRPMRVVNITVMLCLVVFGFAIFRATSLESLGEMIQQVFTNFHADILPQFVAGYPLIVVAIIAGYVLHYLPTRFNQVVTNFYGECPSLLQGLILAIVLFLVIQARSSDLVPFIYLSY